MTDVPLPGHWRRDDGASSLDVHRLAPVESYAQEFEDEQPLALDRPVALTEESQVVKQLNTLQPQRVEHEVLTEEEKIALMLGVPVDQVHKLDIQDGELVELPTVGNPCTEVDRP